MFVIRLLSFCLSRFRMTSPCRISPNSDHVIRRIVVSRPRPSRCYSLCQCRDHVVSHSHSRLSVPGSRVVLLLHGLLPQAFFLLHHIAPDHLHRGERLHHSRGKTAPSLRFPYPGKCPHRYEARRVQNRARRRGYFPRHSLAVRLR